MLIFDSQSAFAQQGDFQVGDVIEYDFLGKKRQGEIIKFTGTGWPIVKLEHAGRTRDHMVPTRRAKLIRRAGQPAGNGGGMTSEMRQWVDSTGKFKIQAKLLSFKDGKAQLEKADGRVITLPVEKLSQADKDFLKQLQDDGDTENPFAGGEMRGASDRGSSDTSSVQTVPAIKPDISINQQTLAMAGWGYRAASASPSPVSNAVIGMPTAFTKHGFHNRGAGAALNTQNSLIAVGRSNPFAKQTEIFVVNLAAGSVLSSGVIPHQDAKVLAVNDAGNIVVTLLKRRGSNPGRVDFWRMGKAIENVAAWETASFHDRDGFDPVHARFVGVDKLVTIGKNLVLWDIASARPRYSISLGRSVAATFSPTSREVALAMDDQVHIVKIETGESIAQIQPPVRTSKLAFSASGQKLAGLDPTSSSLWVADLSGEKPVHQLSGPQTSSDLRWIGEDYLLAGGSLIDVGLRVAVWTYSFEGSLVSSGNGRHWMVTKTKLVPVNLPHKNLAAETEQFNPDDLLILKPGTQVALEFQLPFTANEQQELRGKLTSNLEFNEVRVANGAPLKLICKVERGKQEKRRYSDFGDFFGRRGEDVTYTPHTGSIQLVQGATTLWSRGIRFGPSGMISLKRGEDVNQAIARMCKPTPGFFMNAKLPKYLASLPTGKPLGTSRITEGGIR